jgi:hypothetical protein
MDGMFGSRTVGYVSFLVRFKLSYVRLRAQGTGCVSVPFHYVYFLSVPHCDLLDVRVHFVVLYIACCPLLTFFTLHCFIVSLLCTLYTVYTSMYLLVAVKRLTLVRLHEDTCGYLFVFYFTTLFL